MKNKYVEGIQDFRRGQISNPYNPDTKNNRDWQLGFDRAYFRNLERVKEIERKKSNK